MHLGKLVFLVGLLTPQAQAEESLADAGESSFISLPISVDLSVVEERANAALPARLETIRENNMLCVPAERVKYKYPCFRGLKLYSCDGWTKISPDIYCDINGHVDKRGALVINGSGDSLTVSLPVHASVSAKAGVRETAKADATFFVNAKPTLSEAWKLSLALTSDFRWDKRPTLKLFNFIPVTIGSKVEPKLREKMKDMERNVEAAVDDLDLRGRVEEAWLEVQQPIQLSPNPQAWATFQPLAVGYSGITVSGKRLDTQVMISGETRVTVGPRPAVNPVDLLPLQRLAFEDGRFYLAVPTIVEANELQKSIDGQLGETLNIEVNEGELQGLFSASNLEVSVTEAEGIRLKADIVYDNRSRLLRAIDLFGWFDFDGSMELEIFPRIDSEKNLVLVDSLRISSQTSSSLADTLISVIDLPLVRDTIAGLVEYDFSRDLAEAMEMADKAINVELGEGVRISGNLEAAGVDRFELQDGTLSLFTVASGTLLAALGR